jgi:ferric-dicitrate binding protein FerR (iron transport regulator)
MDDIQELIKRFNARTASRAEREKLMELLRSGAYDDIVGDALYQQLFRELESFDDHDISAGERRAARPLFEQSRERVLAHVQATDTNTSIRHSLPVRSRSIGWRWLAAAAVTAITLGTALFLYVRRPAEPPAIAQAAVQGQVYRGKQFIHLPDGSTVILNADSELRYDSTFGLATRDVTLTGEAFFDIQHDDAKPFRVWSGAVYTYVLGTAFNVKAYPDQPEIVVTVARGKVKVCEARRDLGIVMPQQQLAIHRATLQAEPAAAPDAKALAWKDDFLIFDNTTMADVADAIGKRFGVTIRVTDEIRDCRINAAFMNDEDLAHILTVTSKVLRGSYVQHDKTITISGSCR